MRSFRRFRRPSRVAVAFGAAVLIPVAAVAAVSTTASAGPAVAAATPRCAAAGLVVWLDTQGNGAAGSSYYNLKLTNLSGHACTLDGYPGVSAVGLTGHQLGLAASRNPTHAARLVTLGRNATAVGILQIVDTGNFGSICHHVTAAGLRVLPPGDRASKVVPFPFPACSGSRPVYLSVESVTRR